MESSTRSIPSRRTGTRFPLLRLHKSLSWRSGQLSVGVSDTETAFKLPQDCVKLNVPLAMSPHKRPASCSDLDQFNSVLRCNQYAHKHVVQDVAPDHSWKLAGSRTTNGALGQSKDAVVAPPRPPSPAILRVESTPRVRQGGQHIPPRTATTRHRYPGARKAQEEAFQALLKRNQRMDDSSCSDANECDIPRRPVGGVVVPRRKRRNGIFGVAPSAA